MGHRSQPVMFAPHAQEGWKVRDWIPWEAWNIQGETPTICSSPTRQKENEPDDKFQAFDIFSLGVVHLYMCLGQSETRRILMHIYKGLEGSALSDDNAQHCVFDRNITLGMIA